MGKKMNNKKIKDERALEALLVAAFRLDFPEELSDEQAEKSFQQPVQLSKEDKETVNSWGKDFIEKLIETGKKAMNKTQEIQYLGLMLTATTIIDLKRLAAIIKRLTSLTPNPQ